MNICYVEMIFKIVRYFYLVPTCPCCLPLLGSLWKNILSWIILFKCHNKIELKICKNYLLIYQKTFLSWPKTVQVWNLLLAKNIFNLLIYFAAVTISKEHTYCSLNFLMFSLIKGTSRLQSYLTTWLGAQRMIIRAFSAVFSSISCKTEHSLLFTYLLAPLPFLLLYFSIFSLYVYNTSHRADADPRIEAKLKKL